MILIIINNLTKNTINLGEVSDKNTSSLFYTIEINLPTGVIDGEYTYNLIEGEKILATGLVQIGDYQRDNNINNEYNDNNKKETIVYNG